jgi:hypothetical protein
MNITHTKLVTVSVSDQDRVDVKGATDRSRGRQATVIDPDGNRLVLAAPAPASR